ncbi:MAG: hypothetical protein JWR76_2046, partial [Mucilaginibacter sp.]|nr:hypothetical protein [Mucilaginibacter sp.]
MNGLSPWAVAAANTFSDTDVSSIYTKTCGVYTFNIYCIDDSLWILAEWPKGGKIAFRAAYSPNGELELTSKNETGNEIKYQLSSVIGTISVTIQFPTDEEGTLRYTTYLKPNTDLFIPFWPRDIVIPGKNGKPENTTGEIKVSQLGTRSGMMYFSMTRPKAGSVLYLQNLTALADYNQQTETSAGDTVGGQWPEMGFALPPAIKKPLNAGKKVVISDAIVVFNEEVPADEAGMIEQYFNMLAQAYMLLPKPDTNYHNWPDILKKGLHDLIENAGCWSQVKGHSYFNAYVSDYTTPPEIMVQLAVLLPLEDYSEWVGKKMDIMRNIKETLPTFYDEKLGTIMRWLPAIADTLEGEEEQKKPLVMDSWYLHHPLLNLSRLALKGEAIAKQLFLDSLEYAIKVAHHFDYQWPVFYKMDTLEVLKAETNPGKGGEKDVPGLYAHVML